MENLPGKMSPRQPRLMADSDRIESKNAATHTGLLGYDTVNTDPTERALKGL
jgi:hypothetical protein